MKKIIAATMLLGSISAYAGPYSIKFNKPLVLKGNSLIIVDKMENKASSAGKWQESVSSTQKQNCEFSINVEGRDLAVENKAIGEHYYGSMAVSCEKAGLFGSAFKTTFSRVLLLGIRECVISETVIDNDYCNLRVMALRKETDLSSENGDLISDKPTSRKFYRISSQAAEDYIQKSNLLPNGVNQSLVDSYQSFTLSIGKNGNEFFVPAENERSSFVSGRNIFLKVTEADLDRDVELRNTIEKSLAEMQDDMTAITSAAKPADTFKLKIGGVLGKFTTTVQKLLGIISPVEFFQLEKQLKEFEGNLVTTAKTFNPNVTNRDSFKSNYGAQAASLSIMMDYLKGSSGTQSEIKELPSKPAPPQRFTELPGMDQATFNTLLTKFYTGNRGTEQSLNFYNTNQQNMSFDQFKKFINMVNLSEVNDTIVSTYYYAHYTMFNDDEANEVLSLCETYEVKVKLIRHWNILHSN